MDLTGATAILTPLRLFLLVVALLWLITMSPPVEQFDDGLVLSGALEVLHGRLPYRDFYTLYGPAPYFVLAGMFRVFGIYALAGRVLYVVSATISLVTVIKLQTLLGCQRWIAVLASAASMAWLSGSRQYLYPVYPALTLVLLGILCCIFHWKSGRKAWMCLGGALIGCVILFRHDIAFYSFIFLLAAECFYHLGDGVQPWKTRYQELVCDASLFVGCVLVIALPVVCLVIAHVPLSDVKYQLFFIPSNVYARYRGLPFLARRGSIGEQLAHGIALAAILSAISVLWCSLRPQLKMGRRQWQLSGWVALGGGTISFLIPGLVRPGLSHLASTGVMCSLLLACLLGKIKDADRVAQALISSAVICLVISTAVPAWHAAQYMRKTVQLLALPWLPESFVSSCRPPYGMERATCIQVNPAEEQLAGYIQQHTSPEEKIYSGTGRHDKLFMNDVLIYFLSKREPGTKWFELDPGVETTDAIQRQIVGDLERNHVRYLILNTTWDSQCEPNESCKSSNIALLDKYIYENYKIETTFSNVLILRRRTLFTDTRP
jgi:hypothetical protein